MKKLKKIGSKLRRGKRTTYMLESNHKIQDKVQLLIQEVYISMHEVQPVFLIHEVYPPMHKVQLVMHKVQNILDIFHLSGIYSKQTSRVRSRRICFYKKTIIVV